MGVDLDQTFRARLFGSNGNSGLLKGDARGLFRSNCFFNSVSHFLSSLYSGNCLPSYSHWL